MKGLVTHGLWLLVVASGVRSCGSEAVPLLWLQSDEECGRALSRQQATTNRNAGGLPHWHFFSFPTLCGLAFGSAFATMLIVLLNDAYYVWLASLCGVSFCTFHIITQ